MRKWLLLGQGSYFALTGVWPLLHMPSFLAVTGPKNEVRLVVTVGLLILAIGAALLTAAFLPQEEKSPQVLGFFSALAMGAVDMRYATRDEILDVYLLDALIEFTIATTWVWLFFKKQG
ncbi:hypothetical protein ACD591_04030 [Rufibacter glacialis]|uniref:DUF4345 domain-containing protein n=1 Tax=Rufibacter glacialis TaxID=1259555 RepID=A0A5M8QHW2_9BACT|nr:hypothetical protein [Rufibacter glacialis]KAA6434530.1 hypothetical protein FOE74_10100 [Rufibacter glacialis]GGK70395.1 hypothetical protein GCM10011405_18100 [Rufibacter glacialis]